MTQNPYANAVFAALYIIVVVNLINFIGTHTEGGDNASILMPISFISLLVLSVAIMGYFFAVGPIRLYVDGKKQEAVTHFLKTVATFACFVALFVGVVIYTI